MTPRRSLKNALNSAPFRYFHMLFKMWFWCFVLFFSFLNLALNSNLTLKFIDCQNFELVYTHWRFWKKSDIIVCPQSSGEPSCSLSNIKTLLAKKKIQLTKLSIYFSFQSLLQDHEGSAQLMLDADYRFQVMFPFCTSTQALELLQVPNSLHLDFLNRIWHTDPLTFLLLILSLGQFV